MRNQELARNNLKRALETSGDASVSYAISAMTYSMLAQIETFDEIRNATLKLSSSIAALSVSISRSAAYK